MSKPYRTGLFWFRRDLRIHDNAGLFHALQQCDRVHLVFVFDTDILQPLPRQDRRVEFILNSLSELDQLAGQFAPGAGLLFRHGAARHEIPAISEKLQVDAVFTNHDDEPAALERDAAVRTSLSQSGRAFLTFKDQCIFERREVLTQSGTVYGVFTPYKNAWLRQVNSFFLRSYPVERYAHSLAPRPADEATTAPTLSDLGFETTNLGALKLPSGVSGASHLLSDFLNRIDRYQDTRDYPALKGPSYLSVHLRFGTTSIRELARTAHQRASSDNPGASTWLNELIWRDFYMQILANHPRVVERSFKPEYDAIVWESGPQAEAHFKAWCEGRTGYPIVDAAMMQLNQTGYMHNRLRMVVASFLVKDLGIDWRWGERYFALHLNDFDLAANNGGWQWASSSGCDAQPYFRIFNPISQSEKFDKDGRFIERYLPQLSRLPAPLRHAPWLARPIDLQSAGLKLGQDYPMPIVQHDEARQKTLERYAVVKKAG